MDSAVWILFDEKKTGTLGRNFVKNAFQKLAKLEKSCWTWWYGIPFKGMRKREIFFKDFWKPSSGSNSWQKRESNYERNIHIFKMKNEAVILRVEQGLALQGCRDHGKPASYDDDGSLKKVHRGNFLAIINTFAKLDTILKNHMEQGSPNAKMLSWNILKDVVSCLEESVRDRLKGDISESTYYKLIADEVTEKYSNKDLLLICLRYLISVNRERRTYETFFDSTHVKERSIVQLIGKSILEMLENNGISVSDCRAQAYNNVKDMSSEVSGADAFIKKQQMLLLKNLLQNTLIVLVMISVLQK